jgi:uncharacterized delta-60 repeat protein
MNRICGWAVAAAVATTLSACGGAGDSGSTGGPAPAIPPPPKAGELDATFGNGGVAFVPASSNPNVTTLGNAGIQGADQRIWVVGAEHDYSDVFFGTSATMARFRADGSLDTTLKATGPVAAGENAAIFSAPAGLVITYDSGSNCVGASCLEWTTGLASIDETGAPNGAFANKSVLAFKPEQVFPDGTGGSFMLGNYALDKSRLTRIDATGREDTLYATNASAAYPCAAFASDVIAPAAAGRLVVATNTSDSRTCIARLNADGTLDTGFGNAGHTIWNEASNGVPRLVVVAPDQTIMVVVSLWALGANRTFVYVGTWLQRFSAAGQPLDASHLSVDPIVDARAATVQSDGRLLIAGYATRGSSQPVLVRLDKAGNRDAGFGTGGVTSLTTPAGVLQPSQVFIGGDGRIYVVGSLARDASAPSRTQLAVARFGA